MEQEADSEELSVFVTSTLKAIASGVAAAQDTVISSGHRTGVSAFTAPKEVEFDIAVSAKQSAGVGGGLKLVVFGIGANFSGKHSDESSTVSRVRFAVPTNFKANKAPNMEIPSTATGFSRP